MVAWKGYENVSTIMRFMNAIRIRAIMGLISSMPIRGINLRMGPNIGSVTLYIIWTNGL